MNLSFFTPPYTILIIIIFFGLASCGGGGGSPSVKDGLIEISTLEELDQIRNNLLGGSLNDGVSDCPDTGCVGYKLVNDLDFDTNGDGLMDPRDRYYDYDKDGSNNGWLPIGNSTNHFNAIFDGNGFVINNLYINRPASDAETGGNSIGLFGWTGDTGFPATLRNIKLEGSLTSITGDENVGIVAGSAYNTNLSNIVVTGKIVGRIYAGGLVGFASIVNLTKAASGGQVEGTDAVGGIFGFASETVIEDSLTSSDIEGTNMWAGGLVGDLSFSSILKNSFASGSVTGNLYSGGLVGNLSDSEIANSYTDGAVIGEIGTGGLVGFANNNSTIEGSYSTGALIGNVNTGGLVGNLQESSINDSYSNASVTGKKSSGGLVGYAFFHTTISKSYARGRVAGGVDTGGLVGETENNIKLIDCYSTGNVVANNNNTGGLVGNANRQSVLVSGAFDEQITNCFATGDVIGTNYVGGLVGRAYGLTQTSTFATGSVTGNTYVGGLNGGITGNPAIASIENSFAVGSVSLSPMSSPPNNLAGFIGYSDNVTYINNYFSTSSTGYTDAIAENNTTGNLNPAGIQGNLLSDLQTAISPGENIGGATLFVGWGTEWNFGNNNQLPGLIIEDTIYRDGDGNGELDQD